MPVILSQKVGSEGSLRVCNATCHNARKPKCDCICGGRYHGSARGGVVPRREDLKVEQDVLDALAMPATTTGTGHASDYAMGDLIGKRVRTLVPFPGGGIDKGEEGIVKQVYGWKGHAGAWVEWTNKPRLPSGQGPRDGFGREGKYDETSWLQVVEA
jgi:hypothetical protein